jgi:transposase-like protein
MTEIHETLTAQDIMRIFHVSENTLYRWVAQSRAGKGQFPLPIGGHKQRLCWSRDAIIAFQNRNTVPPAEPESAKSRQKRHTVACQSLRKRGVNIRSNTGEPHEH